MKPYKVIFTNSEDCHAEQRRSKLFTTGRLIWYTDGSENYLGSGAKVFKLKPSAEITIAMQKFPSIFQAEIVDIKATLQEILVNGFVNHHIYILYDGQAALKAFHSEEITFRLAWSFLQDLLKVSEKNGSTWSVFLDRRILTVTIKLIFLQKLGLQKPSKGLSYTADKVNQKTMFIKSKKLLNSKRKQVKLMVEMLTATSAQRIT